MWKLYGVLVVCVLAGGVGCSNSGTDLSRFKIEQLTPEIAHANSMRSLIESLQHQFKTEGLRGLQVELATLEERLEEFAPDQIDGPDRTTYDKIIANLRSLAAESKSPGANKTELSELLSALETASLSLPKADGPPAASS